jgi:hypothetical protein
MIFAVYANYSSIKDVFFLREKLSKNMRLIMISSEILENKKNENGDVLTSICNHLALDGSELMNKDFEIGMRLIEN